MSKLPMITCFCIPTVDSSNVDAIAIDEQGQFVTGQICTGPYWARKDIFEAGEDSFHMWFYSNRYPNGYGLQWVDFVPRSWDGQREHTDESVKPFHDDKRRKEALYNVTT